MATATSKVSGIESESPTSKASLAPEIPRSTIAANNLETIISTVISNAPETTPSKGSALRSNDAPT